MFAQNLLLKLWRVFDPAYSFLIRLKPIVPSSEKEAILRIRLTKYKGNNVILSDGTSICKNDLLLKIHLYNIQALRNHSRIKNDTTKGREMYRKVKNSMPHVVEYIKNHPQESEIKGIIGITSINKGVRFLGFECITPTNKFYSLFKKISQMPIYLLSSNNISVKEMKNRHTVYLMMSKERLFELHSPKSQSNK